MNDSPALRVVGAGLGRTGTFSLKMALEELLGAPCYHMMGITERPGHVAAWRDAANGRMPDWQAFLSGYAAAVDWPASAFWRELSDAFPDAVVLLSWRDAESWWRSASATIFPSIQRAEGEWRDMLDALFQHRFVTDLDDKDACIRAFRQHLEEVRDTVPAGRLVEWQAGDGWAPICRALDLPVPETPFPHANSTEDFLSRHG